MRRAVLSVLFLVLVAASSPSGAAAQARLTGAGEPAVGGPLAQAKGPAPVYNADGSPIGGGSSGGAMPIGGGPSNAAAAIKRGDDERPAAKPSSQAPAAAAKPAAPTPSPAGAAAAPKPPTPTTAEAPKPPTLTSSGAPVPPSKPDAAAAPAAEKPKASPAAASPTLASTGPASPAPKPQQEKDTAAAAAAATGGAGGSGGRPSAGPAAGGPKPSDALQLPGGVADDEDAPPPPVRPPVVVDARGRELPQSAAAAAAANKPSDGAVAAAKPAPKLSGEKDKDADAPPKPQPAPAAEKPAAPAPAPAAKPAEKQQPQQQQHPAKNTKDPCSLSGEELLSDEGRLLFAVQLNDKRTVVPAGTFVSVSIDGRLPGEAASGGNSKGNPDFALAKESLKTVDNFPAGVLLLSKLTGAKPLHCIPAPPAPEPLYTRTDPVFSSTYDIDIASQALPKIPKSFLGISHEWPYVEEIANLPSYMEVMKSLSSYGGGPLIVRVGGGSTDMQRYVPTTYVWQSLNRLHEATGAKFILGLNLEARDPELARQQMAAAEANMAPGSILSFEIGNEPNYYTDMEGKSGNDYIKCCFIRDWMRHATHLTCPNSKPEDPACRQGLFAGPVWGHVHMYPTTLEWFLKSTSKWLNMVTVHWYKATKETPNTAVTLLDEEPIRKEMEHLKRLVEMSNSWGKPLRVAEMNTISNSGREGVSNVFSAALWTLDGCFEVAATGAVGVNLHQGAGQNLYSALIRWYKDDDLGPVILKPPFYAYAMWKQAVRADARMLPATRAESFSNASSSPQSPSGFDGIKVWPLWDEGEGEVRVVVINKRPTEAGEITLRLDPVIASKFRGPASVSRLVARGDRPLEARGGISFGGITYAMGGKLQGRAVTEDVPRTVNGGKAAWTVYMPAGSAALVTIKLGS